MGCEEGAHLKENETQAEVHEGLKENGKSEGKKSLRIFKRNQAMTEKETQQKKIPMQL